MKQVMAGHLGGHLAMLAFSALVAGSFSLGGMVANDISPSALNALRFFLAAVVIGGLALVTTGLPRRAWVAPWRYAILGGIFAGYFVLMFYGLKTAAPVATAAVFTLTPVMSAAFGWIFLRQTMTGRMALALAIGVAGALWVIFRADLAALRAFEVGEGEVIYFWGCVAHAAYTPLVRRFNRGEPTIVFGFGIMCAACVSLLIWGWGDIWATDWVHLPTRVWGVLSYLVIFATAASMLLLQIGSMRLPAAKVMAYTYLVPSWVILWQIGLGRGAPPLMVAVGVGLTTLALVLLLKPDTASG